MDNKSYYIRMPKSWARMTMIVGITALIAAPLTAVASHVFNDVPSGHTFPNDISWLADAGVTKGCNPPANTHYCPKDNVTRAKWPPSSTGPTNSVTRLKDSSKSTSRTATQVAKTGSFEDSLCAGRRHGLRHLRQRLAPERSN